MLNNGQTATFGSVLQELGFGGDSQEATTFAENPVFDSKALNVLEKASQQQVKPIVTGNDKPELVDTKKELSQLPEFLKPHEEILNKKFEFDGDDDTDYTSLAIEEFGTNFSYIKTRDAFYDQMVMAQTIDQQLSGNESYHKIVEYLETPGNETQLLRDAILEGLQTQMTYTPKNYQDQLDQYFEEGEMNEEGKRKVAQIKKALVATRSRIEAEASTNASRTVANYKEYRNTVEDEIKNFNPFGIELSEDLRRHIGEVVRAGKHNQVDPKSPAKSRAQREILQALFTSEKAALEFINIIAQKGIEHGSQKILRNKF